MIYARKVLSCKSSTVVVYCIVIAMTLFRRDSVTGTPIVPKNLVCSRLRTEFEEIEFLGKGGFGDVVMVRICCIEYVVYCVFEYRIASNYGRSRINAWSHLVAGGIQYHDKNKRWVSNKLRVSNIHPVQSLFLTILCGVI